MWEARLTVTLDEPFTLDHIDLSSYIAEISDQSVIGFGSLNERVRVTMQLEPISVDVDAAIPIGLIECLQVRLSRQALR